MIINLVFSYFKDNLISLPNQFPIPTFIETVVFFAPIILFILQIEEGVRIFVLQKDLQKIVCSSRKRIEKAKQNTIAWACLSLAPLACSLFSLDPGGISPKIFILPTTSLVFMAQIWGFRHWRLKCEEEQALQKILTEEAERL